MSLVAGLPAIAALLLYLVAVRAGFKLSSGPVSPWLVVEAVSIVTAIGLIAAAVTQMRQRRADGWQDYDGPSPFLVAGAFLGTVTALTLPLEVGLKTMSVDLDSAPATLAILVVYLATYVGLVHFLAVRSGALTWRDIARPGRLAPSQDDWTASGPAGWTGGLAGTLGSWRSRVSSSRLGDVLLPLAMVLPLLVASNLAAGLLLLALGLHPSDIAPEIPAPTTDLDRLLAFVAIAVVAPIGEEIFFRGFATNAWGRSLSRNSTILRASLFFAFIHVMNVSTTDASVSWRAALFNFGARIPVAVTLTWLYMRRRSILASGTLHVAYNGLITLISFL